MTVCLIIDADCVGLVFGSNRSAAGRDLAKWLKNRGARLVAGGQLREELKRDTRFQKWAEEAQKGGRFKKIPGLDIAREESRLPRDHCRSNDLHVIALARASGARILYSKDRKLQDDFKDPRLVDKPEGILLPPGESRNASRMRRQILNRRELCPNR